MFPFNVFLVFFWDIKDPLGAGTGAGTVGIGAGIEAGTGVGIGVGTEAGTGAGTAEEGVMTGETEVKSRS